MATTDTTTSDGAARRRLVIVESPAKARTIAGYLGPDHRLVPAIVERYGEAVRGVPAVNCDLCAYRAPWPGREGRQGQPIGVGHSHLAAEHREHRHPGA